MAAEDFSAKQHGHGLLQELLQAGRVVGAPEAVFFLDERDPVEVAFAEALLVDR